MESLLPIPSIAQAVKRFGLGARPGEIAAIGDPRSYVDGQLGDRNAARLEHPTLWPSDEVLRAVERFRQRGKMVDQRKVAPPPARRPRGAANDSAGAIYAHEIEWRMKRAVETATPFAERMVYFWSNHFAIANAGDPPLRAVAGAYEREAIRPHVFGRFADMLLSVARHPAMLRYLDGYSSIGPGSRAGREGKGSFNENLAREILELHTLGVDGGYEQSDVTEFAKALTGWTYSRFSDDDGGRFLFLERRHEPGPVQVLGHTYAGDGPEKAEAVLQDLARSPATARFLATKLVRHVHGDPPAPDLVAKMADAYLQTDTDLAALYRELFASDLSWTTPPRMVVPIFDLLVSVGRAIDWRMSGEEANATCKLAGKEIWNPPSPQGYLEIQSAEELGGELKVRVLWLETFCRRFYRRDGLDVAETVYPGIVDPDLLEHLRALAKNRSLLVFLASPFFQRR